jgi:hypothetical protein
MTITTEYNTPHHSRTLLDVAGLWICKYICICQIGISLSLSLSHTHTSPLTFGGPILHYTSSLLPPSPPSQNIYLPPLCSTVQIWWMKALVGTDHL